MNLTSPDLKQSTLSVTEVGQDRYHPMLLFGARPLSHLPSCQIWSLSVTSRVSRPSSGNKCGDMSRSSRHLKWLCILISRKRYTPKSYEKGHSGCNIPGPFTTRRNAQICRRPKGRGCSARAASVLPKISKIGFSGKWHVFRKISKFCFESFHDDTDSRLVFKLDLNRPPGSGWKR